jgi:hypothetical protein
LSVMDLVNHSGTPKLWAISHENGPKTQKRWVFGHASQTCTECHGPCKSLRNPKTMGNIAHENGPKMQKQWFFGDASQTCTECHGPCKWL